MNNSTVVVPGCTPEPVRLAVCATLAAAAEARRFPLARIGRIPAPDVASSVASVGADALATLLRRVAPCASGDEMRPQLNAVLLQFSHPRVRAVATDGHRLAVADGRTTGGTSPFEVLVPLAQVRRLVAFAVASRLPKVEVPLVFSATFRRVRSLGLQDPTSPPRPATEEVVLDLVRVESPDGSSIALTHSCGTFPPYEDIIDGLRCRRATNLHAGYVRDALAPAASARDLDDRYVEVWLQEDEGLLGPVVFSNAGFTCVVMPARVSR